jgi:hypothetical protein
MTMLRWLVIGGLSVAGLSRSAFAQQEASRDGNWAGRTSQGRPISFRIEAGTMRVLDLDWTMQLDQVCPGRVGSSSAPGRIARADILFFHPRARGHEPPRIPFPAFTISRDVETPEVGVTVALSGTFGSDSTVSGDMTLTAAGCPGREAVTWQAGRRPAS